MSSTMSRAVRSVCTTNSSPASLSLMTVSRSVTVISITYSPPLIDIVDKLCLVKPRVLFLESGGHMLHKDAEDSEFLKPVVPKGMERFANNLGFADKVQLVDALYFRHKLLQFSDDFLGSINL